MLYIVFQEKISYLEQLQLLRYALAKDTYTQMCISINSKYEHNRSKFIYQFTNLHLYNTMVVAWFELHYDDPIGHGVDVED